MVFAKHFANDTGGLFVCRVGSHGQFIHGEKYAAVYRFEPVTGIRQGAGYDHAHGVIEVGRAHLLVDIDLLDQ
jgi:hypothetical protein